MFKTKKPRASRPETAGEQLYQLRMARGETQAEFAKHFGVVDSTVSRWEDRGPPTTGAVARLIEFVVHEISVENTSESNGARQARRRSAAP